MRTLVTGGAGFIGSHIVDELVRRGQSVIVYDNLTTGFEGHLEKARAAGVVDFVQADVLDRSALTDATKGVDTVFHLAANADVRGGPDNTGIDLEQNVVATHNVLEAARHAGVRELVFTSSAAVYGEPNVFPTPESYAPLQTSLYGASKLAAEAYVQAYSEYYGIRSFIFRFVSWIGERYSHGVIFDFVKKLKANSNRLDILGDGNQKKSYLHVDDGVQGIFRACDNLWELKNVINLGHEEFMTVTDLARIVCNEMGLEEVEFHYAGGKRGWVGDSPLVHLDITKVKECGFQPRVSIEQGIRRTVRYLLNNDWVLDRRA